MSEKKPIYTFATWRVREGQLAAVLDMIIDLTAKSTAEAGNLLYQIYQSNSETNTLILFEAYKDESALADHRKSEHFQSLVVEKIVPLLENREIVVTIRL